MGHATRFIKTDKRSEIMGVAEEFAFYNVDRQENPSGSYHGNMTIHDNIVCANYEDAVQFINDRDSGWYDDHAVKYKACEDVKETSITRQLKERIKKNEIHRREFIQSHHVWQRKSETIGCPCCKSSLSRLYMEKLKADNCPLCRTDLRSPTIQNRIEKFTIDEKELQNRILEEEHKLKDKAPTKWLVKVEVHC